MAKRSETATSPLSEKDLDRWAQQDAQNDNAKGSEHNFPSFDGRVQYIVQQYIETINQNFMDDFRSRFTDLLDGFTNIVDRLTSTPQTYVKDIVNRVNTNIATADKRYAPNIASLQRELSDWEVRFPSGFHNGIANPKKQNAVWHWGVILFLLAVEVILNSRFFAETSEYGLLGGTMAAVVVSVVNVGLPILVGYFTHKLYYSKERSYRIIGLVLAALLVVFAAVFNYEVAEYRDHLLVNGGKPPSPLPEYFALLVIGGGIAVISFWKMFSFPDPFLRPRRCYQSKNDLVKDYENVSLKSIRDAQRTVSDTLQDVATQIQKAEQAIGSEKANFEFCCSRAIQNCNAND